MDISTLFASSFLQRHVGLDYVIFAVIAGACGLCLLWWFAKKQLIRRGLWLFHLAIFGILALTWYQLQRETQSEATRFERVLQELAATYGSEITALGHENMTLETPADDPRYLSMIDAEKRWLAVNTQVNDIYTFRRLPDGKVVLMVDAETDYDRNGKIEGETEARTQIGEIYSEVDSALESALGGKGTFTPEMTVDRWGSWYSLYIPLYKKDGSQDGVLGVDVKAADYLAKIQRARITTLSQFGVLFFGLLASSGVLGANMLSRRHEDNNQVTVTLAEEKQRYENLVYAVEGVVWESGNHPLTFAYASPAAEQVLGYPVTDWTGQEDFWVNHIHPEDRDRASALRMQHLEMKSHYQMEYRMQHQAGHLITIRERALSSGPTGNRRLRGVMVDISQQQRNEVELEQAHRQLVETSRRAGMAEMATGVLHNVGNVLNSVNVSSTLLGEELRRSSLPVLKKVANLLSEQSDLSSFMAHNPRGQAIPSFLHSLHSKLEGEQQRIGKEMSSLNVNVEHMKEVVMMQQSYARMGGRNEPLDVHELVEDAIQINHAGLVRHGISVTREFQPVRAILAERNKLLQILVNLIRNSKHAVSDTGRADRTIWVKIASFDESFVEIAIRDNGMGISEENMKRIFSYGFTTKEGGHGFGLHSSVNTAREMRGDLVASSPGEGFGATFSLRLPFANAAASDPLSASLTSASATPNPAKISEATEALSLAI